MEVDGEDSQISRTDIFDSGIGVIDTNFFINHHRLFEGILKQGIKYNFLLVIPYCVLQELDGLKVSNRIDSNSRNSLRLSIRVLQDNLQQGNPVLRGQTKLETIAYEEKADDKILDCCLYFKHLFPKNLITLLSDDRLLLCKALINKVYNLDYSTFKSGEDLLTTLANKHYIYNQTLTIDALVENVPTNLKNTFETREATLKDEAVVLSDQSSTQIYFTPNHFSIELEHSFETKEKNEVGHSSQTKASSKATEKKVYLNQSFGKGIQEPRHSNADSTEFTDFEIEMLAIFNSNSRGIEDASDNTKYSPIIFRPGGSLKINENNPLLRDENRLKLHKLIVEMITSTELEVSSLVYHLAQTSKPIAEFAKSGRICVEPPWPLASILIMFNSPELKLLKIIKGDLEGAVDLGRLLIIENEINRFNTHGLSNLFHQDLVLIFDTTNRFFSFFESFEETEALMLKVNQLDTWWKQIDGY